MNLIFIVGTVVVSILAFGNHSFFNSMVFNAYQIKHRKESWRFFSYALIHSGWLHLLINMWVLYSFGRIVEDVFKVTYGIKGSIYYVLLYVGGILFSTVYDYGKHKDDVYYNAVGASGAVSAVVFASILIYPTGGIYLFPIPFALPSWLFGILYLVYSAYMGKEGKDNIGHSAHFWGAIFGLIFTLVVIPGVFGRFIEQLF